jgi:transposase-like protein
VRRRQWSSQEKFKIVLEALSGEKDISLLCKEHKISQTQYYRWRDQFLKLGHQAFEKRQTIQGEKRLLENNKRLKKMLSEIKVELKKIDLSQEG